MGTYTVLWMERKSFLFSSMIVGAILTVAIAIWMLTDIPEGRTFISLAFEFVATVIGLFLFFTAVVAVGRMVFGKSSVAGNFATNVIVGFWSTIIGIIRGGVFGIVIGMFLMIVFAFLFAVVAAGYAIYLPISSIYYFVMYRRECAA